MRRTDGWVAGGEGDGGDGTSVDIRGGMVVPGSWERQSRRRRVAQLIDGVARDELGGNQAAALFFEVQHLAETDVKTFSEDPWGWSPGPWRIWSFSPAKRAIATGQLESPGLW